MGYSLWGRKELDTTEQLHFNRSRRDLEVQEYAEELYKTDLNDPCNCSGVFTHPEPHILKCKVKWALGSIATNKLVEMMECQMSYLKS